MPNHENHSWQLQEAKARLSELVKIAQTSGPQTISVRGQPEVVVMSIEDYEAITTKNINMLEFMQQSPLYGLNLLITRDNSPDRDIDL